MVLMSQTEENNPKDDGALEKRPQTAQALQETDSEPDDGHGGKPTMKLILTNQPLHK